jgi:hypothetical protein
MLMICTCNISITSGFCLYSLHSHCCILAYCPVASEAQACVPPRYKVRSLKDDDDLLAKIDGTGNSLFLLMILSLLDLPPADHV